MREAGKRDVRFITPTVAVLRQRTARRRSWPPWRSCSPRCREEIGPDGRVFFGSFPSEIRPEHISVDALRLVRKYCANDNLIVGAQSGSALGAGARPTAATTSRRYAGPCGWASRRASASTST